MVERSLSMREVPGSIPGASKFIFLSFFWVGEMEGCFPCLGWFAKKQWSQEQK